MSASSPLCEFGFSVARARRTENAASAKSSALPRGGKTGHSCKTQQDKFADLIDCRRSSSDSALSSCASAANGGCEPIRK